jgi:hypothetical protein
MRKPTLILLALLACLVPASSFAQIEIPAGTYDKIIVVIGENLGYENLFHSKFDPTPDCRGDSEDAVYIQTLANLALNYTNAHSSTHPSRPNYMRLFAGMDDGQADGCVCDPTTCTNGFGSNPCDHSCISCSGQMRGVTDTTTLYSELRDDPTTADTSFILWAEGLGSSKFICQNGDYVQKHNPAAFFTNSRNDECNFTVWTGWPQGTLPPAPNQLLLTTGRGVAFVIPGQDHNGHNGMSLADKVVAWNDWLRDNIGPNRSDMKSYVDYALHQGVYAGNTDKVLLIITQDEKSDGDYPCLTCPATQCSANHIILFLIAADLTPKTDMAQVGDPTNPNLAAQYNILKTITKNFSLLNINNATGTSIKVLIPPL